MGMIATDVVDANIGDDEDLANIEWQGVDTAVAALELEQRPPDVAALGDEADDATEAVE